MRSEKNLNLKLNASNAAVSPQQGVMARFMAFLSHARRDAVSAKRVMFWIRSFSILRFMQFALFATIGLDVTVRLPVLLIIGCCSCALMYIIDGLRASNHRKSAAHQKVQKVNVLDPDSLEKHTLSALPLRYKQLMGLNLVLDGLALFNTNLLLIHLAPIVLVLMVFIAIVLYVASSSYVATFHPNLGKSLKMLSAFLVITSCLGMPWLPSGLGLSILLPWLSAGSHQLIFSACAAVILTGFIGLFVWRYEKQFFQHFLARKAELTTSVSDVIDSPLKALGENFTLNTCAAQGLSSPVQRDRLIDMADMAKTVLTDKRPYNRLELEEEQSSWKQRNVFGLLILGAACVLCVGIWALPGSVIQVAPWISVGIHRCVFSGILATFLGVLSHFHFNPYVPKAAGKFFGTLYFFLAIGSCIGMSLLPGKLGLAILSPELNYFVTSHAFLVCFTVFAVVLSIIFACLNKVYEEEDDKILVEHEFIVEFEKLTLTELIDNQYLQYASPGAADVTPSGEGMDDIVAAIKDRIQTAQPGSDVSKIDPTTTTWKDLSTMLISIQGSTGADGDDSPERSVNLRLKAADRPPAVLNAAASLVPIMPVASNTIG